MSYRVLIIDDEPAMREVFADLLEARGHQPTAWPDYLADAPLDGFDRVIMDVKLPSGSGWDLAAQAGRRLGAAARIIITTAGAANTAAERARQEGYIFLAKPFRPKELYEALEKAAR
jgi:DNA-binding NtrC family response regulator